jgi:hypothetical protein
MKMTNEQMQECMKKNYDNIRQVKRNDEKKEIEGFGHFF